MTLRRDAIGVSFRAEHYRALREHEPRLDFVVVPTEAVLTDGERARRQLRWIAGRYPVALHGHGLNLLGHAPLDEAYLEALVRLADEVDAICVTDHLAWCRADGISYHEPLPVPFVPELAELAAARAREVQRRLGRPFGLANVGSYLAFTRSSLTEWEFVNAVIRDAGCGLVLDLEGVLVSAQHQGYEPERYLDAIDPRAVIQIRAARADVRGLHPRLCARGGLAPTVVAWDVEARGAQAA